MRSQHRKIHFIHVEADIARKAHALHVAAGVLSVAGTERIGAMSAPQAATPTAVAAWR